jgi:hypothetical protein
VAEHVAEPVPENYAIGTMLRWIKDDNNKRVALVLKDGILQVKELINGTRTLDERRYHGVKRTFFKDVAAWKASLPEGGAITAKANATEYVSSLEDKTKKPMNPHLTNFGYVAELIKRFSIHSSITANDSLSQAIHKNRQSIKDEFSRLSQCISNIDGNVGLVQTYAHQIAMYARMLTGNLQGAYAKTPEEMSRISYTFRNNYKQKLFAYKGGIKFEIGIAGSKEGGLLALAPRPEGTYPWGPVTVIGSTFADLGIEMKSDGKPRLEVSYRRRRFEKKEQRRKPQKEKKLFFCVRLGKIELTDDTVVSTQMSEQEVAELEHELSQQIGADERMLLNYEARFWKQRAWRAEQQRDRANLARKEAEALIEKYKSIPEEKLDELLNAMNRTY